jgi:hypothetical protein
MDLSTNFSSDLQGFVVASSLYNRSPEATVSRPHTDGSGRSMIK